MRFLNYKHASNFQELVQEDNTHPKDCERNSLFYILAGNEDLFKKRYSIYDFKDNSIKLECLTDGSVDFSTSSKALVRLAFNLYNNYEDKYTSPLDIFYSLDSNNYNLAMQSMNVRFGRVSENEISKDNDEEIDDGLEL